MDVCKVLEKNILGRYERLYGKNIQDDIKKGKIRPEIQVEYGLMESIDKPYADENGIIHIQKQYVDFLWILIYGAWVQYEESVMKNELKKEGKKICQDPQIITDSQILLNSVETKKIAPWPLPHISPSDNSFYSNRVNGIFLDALCILLFHETSHILNKHFETKKIIKKNIEDLKLSKKGEGKEKIEEIEKKIQEEKLKLKEIEKEADVFALEHVLSDSKELEKDFVFKGKSVSIVISFMSFLFLLDDPSLVKQDEHPDLDERLFNAIEWMDIQENRHAYYIYAFADLLIREFYKKHQDFYKALGKKFNDTTVETAKDLFSMDIETIKVEL